MGMRRLYDTTRKKADINADTGLTGADRLQAVDDPQKSFAAVTKGDYVNFRKNFGQFERDVLGEAMTDQSIVQDAAIQAPEQFGLAANVQRRNMSRFGGDVPIAQQQQATRNLGTSMVLGTTGAINNARLNQRDVNTNRFYELINIGQGVYNQSTGAMGDAAKMAADREAARKAASEQRKAQRLSLGLSAGLAFIALSDIRLKKNIEQVDIDSKGFGYYTWEWTEEALQLGADKYPTTGVLAQEVQEVYPEAVFSDRDTGYLMVNYSLLD